MSVATIHTAGTTTALETERAIRWYLDRRASTRPMCEQWTVAAYLLSIDRSSLKTPVKNTLRAMVEKAGGRHTTVSRAAVCYILKMKRVATITAHWDEARDAGLLKSVQRHNQSSVHTFLVPGIDNCDEEVVWGEPWDGWHIWTQEEDVWWDSLDGEELMTLPWGDRRPPF